MAIYHLFHVKPLRGHSLKAEAVFELQCGSMEALTSTELHRRVAIVDASNPENLFRKTNSIERYWPENEGVLEAEEQLRSTSVGDVIVDAETRQVLFCANIGWTPLPDGIASDFLEAVARQAETSPIAPQ